MIESPETPGTDQPGEGGGAPPEAPTGPGEGGGEGGGEQA
jgi:hypothetical protein